MWDHLSYRSLDYYLSQSLCYSLWVGSWKDVDICKEGKGSWKRRSSGCIIGIVEPGVCGSTSQDISASEQQIVAILLFYTCLSQGL